MNSASQLALNATEQGYIPDIVTRRGIRHLLKQRLNEIQRQDTEVMAETQSMFIDAMSQAAIALVPEKANEQHYEVPTAFYHKVLGPRMKYSSAFWPEGTSDLASAEAEGLRQTCLHAQLEDGQSILELGCGWGSLTLWMASHYPHSQITAVSNSLSQGQAIESKAMENNLGNITVLTCDMNDFDINPGQFDRVVSVEMFEHMRNWQTLYQRIALWLKPGGRFFKHIFVHASSPYLFEDKDDSDWMSQHFFTGGMMPSDDLPLFFQDDLKFLRRWRWDGTHYEKTANAWLSHMDLQKDLLMPLFAEVYGERNAQQWWTRWRIFFMACAELFGYAKGQEWWVGHYLFEKR